MNHESGPEAGLKGIAEDVKGKAKEGIGSLTGNDDMKNEGVAQQEKADAERDVAAHEAQAEEARGEAAAAETEQRAFQN